MPYDDHRVPRLSSRTFAGPLPSDPLAVALTDRSAPPVTTAELATADASSSAAQAPSAVVETKSGTARDHAAGRVVLLERFIVTSCEGRAQRTCRSRAQREACECLREHHSLP